MTTANRSISSGLSEAESAEIASRLRLVVGRLTRRLRLDPEGEQLTSTQLVTLSIIDQLALSRIGDLATAEGISAATMTRVVAALEDRGLVERRPDPNDGRACLVLLSSHGEAEVARIRKQRTGYLATRLRECTPEQQAVLVAALPIMEMMACDPAVEV